MKAQAIEFVKVVAVIASLAGCTTGISEQCNKHGICATVYRDAAGLFDPLSTVWTVTNAANPTKIIAAGGDSQGAPVVEVLKAVVRAAGTGIGGYLIGEGLLELELKIAE